MIVELIKSVRGSTPATDASLVAKYLSALIDGDKLHLFTVRSTDLPALRGHQCRCESYAQCGPIREESRVYKFRMDILNSVYEKNKEWLCDFDKRYEPKDQDEEVRP